MAISEFIVDSMEISIWLLITNIGLDRAPLPDNGTATRNYLLPLFTIEPEFVLQAYKLVDSSRNH